MSSETTLYSTLTAAAGVTDLVGTGSSARIYPDVVPQEIAGTSIAYVRVGTESTITLHSNVPTSTFATLEIWCMATTRAAAEALADAVLVALGAGQFLPLDRRSEYDHDNELFAVVLTVRHFSTS